MTHFESIAKISNFGIYRLKFVIARLLFTKLQQPNDIQLSSINASTFLQIFQFWLLRCNFFNKRFILSLKQKINRGWRLKKLYGSCYLQKKKRILSYHIKNITTGRNSQNSEKLVLEIYLNARPVENDFLFSNVSEVICQKAFLLRFFTLWELLGTLDFFRKFPQEKMCCLETE